MTVISTPSIYLPRREGIADCTISLAASKSISNRALIIAALCPQSCTLDNLSEARDTRIMQKLLSSSSNTLNARDAGTTMRFLTAYLSLTNQKKELTGTTRMQQRPIKILVNALRQLGARIDYLGNDGYPPLAINGFEGQLTDTVDIPGDISSQYISALLMTAPKLPQGLKLRIIGKLMSEPYVRMTLKLMERFGVTHRWEDQAITVPPQEYQAGELKVESDWSAASYWYSIMALCEKGKITLKGLEDKSLQGDRQIVDIMKSLGVQSRFHPEGVTLTRCARSREVFQYDFAGCPDLAQTVISLGAALKIPMNARGLESLRIKETDRIHALQVELAKIGARLMEHQNHWELIPGERATRETLTFQTYEDHRMAMALAPLALRFSLIIEDPTVVEKSYPGFWQDLATAGISSADKGL